MQRSNVKPNQVADARRSGVGIRQINHVPPLIGPGDRVGERLTDAPAGLVADRRPFGDIEIHPAHEAEPLPGQPGRAVQRQPSRLDR